MAVILATDTRKSIAITITECRQPLADCLTFDGVSHNFSLPRPLIIIYRSDSKFSHFPNFELSRVSENSLRYFQNIQER